MSDPARGQEDGLDPEYVAITKRMCGALRDAATTLSAEFTGDEVEDCLMRWRIVLSILGADVVDGTVTLLEYGNLAPLIDSSADSGLQRATSVLLRPSHRPTAQDEGISR